MFYGHLGHWKCAHGHVARPNPTLEADRVTKMELKGAEFDLVMGQEVRTIKLPLPGLYNVYNAVAAVAAGQALGVSLATAASSVERTEAAFGRVERIKIRERTIYLLLIKNPAGFAQVVETFLLTDPGSQILMAVNDQYADGRDVSWLWDVPLEPLAKLKPNIVTAGLRGSDMALRLKYAGITAVPVELMEDALKSSIDAVPAGSNLYVLPTYTAMLQIRKLLSKMSQIEDVWK